MLGLSGVPMQRLHPEDSSSSSSSWETAPPTVHIHTGLARAVPRDAPPEERRRAAEETLSQLPPADVTVFTDGSAAAGTENGGAGVVIWSGGREEARVKTAAGRFTTSYIAELHALNEACKYLEAELGIPNEIRYFGISVLPAVLSGTEIPNAISVPIPIPNG